ncbi:MAG: WD40/YVTN/BNR-like repeat-containing protein, partial [Candidatus Aminicenantales bacterium]
MRLNKRSIVALCAIALLVALAAAAPQGKAPTKGPKKIENTDPALRLKAFEQHLAMKQQSPFKDVKWRFVGPFDLSGRCTDVAVPAGSRTVFYAGAASGGVFKTVNAGTTWEPIFDDMPTLSIGDLAVAESDPNIVWAGTGEANIFRGSEAGLGVFKSTDAGKTWKHMGLEATSTIARVVIHPKNPDIVYVAATGHEWTYNPDRGVYKTTDGG